MLGIRDFASLQRADRNVRRPSQGTLSTRPRTSSSLLLLTFLLVADAKGVSEFRWVEYLQTQTVVVQVLSYCSQFRIQQVNA